MTFNPTPYEDMGEEGTPKLTNLGSPEHWFYLFPNGQHVHVAKWTLTYLPAVPQFGLRAQGRKEPLISYHVGRGKGRDGPKTWATFTDFMAVLNHLKQIRSKED